MTGRSNWRSVRLQEGTLRESLQQRHALWLHGWCIGLLVLGLMWAVSHLQLVMGSDSLALRYLITLGAGYLGYLAVLRLWAGWLVSRGDAALADAGDAAEAVDLAASLAPHVPLPRAPGLPAGGGDFAGAGASADFSVDGLGEIAGKSLGAAAESDDAAVVVVPVVAVFLIGLAVLFGAGALLLLYFGAEALLAVAVELSFTYVTARTAVKVAREGWMQAVVRLTWKPLLGALACAVLLGATIDWFIPQAHSLPHALQILRAAR